MKHEIKISLIIPVFNGEQYIKRCFDILSKQDFNENWEIIIVNDASTDNSIQVIEQYKLLNLKLFSLPKNCGQSAARKHWGNI